MRLPDIFKFNCDRSSRTFNYRCFLYLVFFLRLGILARGVVVLAQLLQLVIVQIRQVGKFL